METVTDFIFLGSKIIVDGDCSHEIKRRLFLGRNFMRNIDSVLKSRDTMLPTNVHVVSYGFSSSHVWMSFGPKRKLSAEEFIFLNCGTEEDS